jgi:hypothetical protein
MALERESLFALAENLGFGSFYVDLDHGRRRMQTPKIVQLLDSTVTVFSVPSVTALDLCRTSRIRHQELLSISYLPGE